MTYFHYKGLSFRPVERRDLSQILELRNDYSTWSNLTDPRQLREGLQERWLNGVNSSTDRFYWVVEGDGHPFIGMIRMDEYDPVNRSIRVGADVAVGLRRRGFGARIYEALLHYCFGYLGIHRIWLLVLETNSGAMGLYRKMGFQEEGRMRHAVWRFGRWVDYVMMSVLEKEPK